MLKKLFRRNLDRNATKPNDKQSEPAKKQTLTEKLGIPFGLNEIEYISIIHQDLDEPMYYLCVSNREKLKIMYETRTSSKVEIINKLSELKAHFKPYGNYVDLGLEEPLINLNRINYTRLVWDEIDENENRNKRNHCVIGLSNGQTFSTLPQVSLPDKLNRNEFIDYTFWSSRNERLYGK